MLAYSMFKLQFCSENDSKKCKSIEIISILNFPTRLRDHKKSVFMQAHGLLMDIIFPGLYPGNHDVISEPKI